MESTAHHAGPGASGEHSRSAAGSVEVDAARRTFLARVGSDLRSPVASILGFAELLQGDASLLGPKAREYVAAIHRNGFQALQRINELLDLASIQAGQFAVRPEPTILGRVVDDLRSAVEPQVMAGRYRMAWPDRADLGGVTVRVDRRRLVQALVHLVDNACKNTLPGGRLAVEVSQGGDATRLSIIDSGQGVPPEVRRRFLAGELGPGQATGFGLAIVRGVVEGHGGRVEIGDGMGRGSCFTLVLPQLAA